MTSYQEAKLTDRYVGVAVFGPADLHWAWWEARHGQLALWEQVYRCPAGCGQEVVARAPGGRCGACGAMLVATGS
jgi:hypothetical protein